MQVDLDPTGLTDPFVLPDLGDAIFVSEDVALPHQVITYNTSNLGISSKFYSFSA